MKCVVLHENYLEYLLKKKTDSRSSFSLFTRYALILVPKDTGAGFAHKFRISSKPVYLLDNQNNFWFTLNGTPSFFNHVIISLTLYRCLYFPLLGFGRGCVHACCRYNFAIYYTYINTIYTTYIYTTPSRLLQIFRSKKLSIEIGILVIFLSFFP